MAVRLILDTDIGSDIDDALALAFALRHPEIELVAVTTVADDVTKRGNIARELLRIAGREDIEVAPGVGWTVPPAGRRSWFGHEDRLPASADGRPFQRDAVTLLLEETRAGDVQMATVGMQSNVAAALDADPGFASRVSVLNVMGGVFAPIRIGDAVLPPSIDHNLCVHPEASVRALNAGMRTIYTPLDVTIGARLPISAHEHLRRGDELCRALARHFDVWLPTSLMPEGVAALMHDPLAVACTVDRTCVTSETFPVTVAIHDGAVRTFIDPLDGRDAEVITSVDGDAFAELWLDTVLR
jgi:purine nucleosidase